MLSDAEFAIVVYNIVVSNSYYKVLRELWKSRRYLKERVNSRICYFG